MTNITEEGLSSFELMMKNADKMDATKQVIPQVCDINDAECEACGS